MSRRFHIAGEGSGHLSRRALALLLIVAAAGGASARAVAVVPSKLPNSTAVTKPRTGLTLYVSPSGSDSTRCTQAQPCASFATAYSLATSVGARVEVAPGSYGVQTMSVNNIALTASHPAVFRPPIGVAAGEVTVQQLNLLGANNVTFEDITFGTGAEAGRAWYQRFSSNTLCDGCVIRGQLAVDGDDHDIAFKNGTVGNYIADNADPQIGSERGPTVTNSVQPQNVSFVNESFHDIDSASTSTHTECLQIIAVHGLLIDRSKFYRCNIHGDGSKNGIQFAGYRCHDVLPNTEANCGTLNDYWNVTIQNSMFNGGPPGSNQIAFGWDDQNGSFYDCRNVLVRNNAIVGTVLWGCNNGGQNGGKAAVISTNNIETFQFAGVWARRQCNATFSYDVWERRPPCPGSHTYIRRVRFVSRGGARFDLRLKPGSFGIDRGNPSNYAPTDFEGRRRIGERPDIGAGEW